MTTAPDSRPPILEFPPFRLDLRQGVLHRDGAPLAVRPKTLAVLAHLAARPGELVTKQALLDAVWTHVVVAEDVVRVSVGELRAVLGDERTAPRFIETVPRRGYRFIAKMGAVPGADAAAADPAIVPSPASGVSIFGRDRERAAIVGWLRTASTGQRRVVFVSGEPGIGKTTLVDSVLDDLLRRPDGDVRIARGQCMEHYGGGEPYLPVLGALAEPCRGADGEAVRALLAQHAPDWLLRAVAPASAPASPGATSTGSHEHTLHRLAASIDALAAATPLVLVLEDVHWSDYATLDLLSLLARRREPSRLLVICTLRAADAIVRAHPVADLRRDLIRQGLCHEVALGGLPPADVAACLAARFPDAALPDELLTLAVERTEGNPFFLGALVDHLIDCGLVVRRDGGWDLRGGIAELRTAIPDRLRSLIEPRLERLDPNEIHALEWGSVVGPKFSAHAVARLAPAGSELADVETVEQVCDALVRRQEILRSAGEASWRDGSTSARYAFRHAIYREVVHQRILPSAVRRLHQSLGENLEAAWAGSTAEIAALLAVHFERGRDVERAIRYRGDAAAHARSRGAWREARLHLEAALELLRSREQTPERSVREIALLQDLGVALFALGGYGSAEAESVFARMRELAARLDSRQTLFQAMQAQFVIHTMRAELTIARALGDELIALAAQLGDPVEEANSNVVQAANLFVSADLEAAGRYVERGLALFDPALPPLPVDIGITSATLVASIHACKGRISLARECITKILERGAEIGTPFARAWAASYAAQISMMLDDVTGARRHACDAIRMCDEYDLAALGVTAEMILAWCDIEAGDASRLGALRDAFAQYVATGQRFGTSSFGRIVARGHLLAGDVAGARRVAEELLAFVAETGERVYEPEFHTVLADCLLAESSRRANRAEAIALLERAIVLAEEHGCPLFALRAATSLCRAQPSARARLEALVERFEDDDEGRDVQRARALLASRR